MEDLKDMVAQRAKEMFYNCDTEGKGYITKNEIERLANMMPLSKEQLEAVFDSLDDDGNGQLTLLEFTDGFGQYIIGDMPEPKRRHSSVFGSDGNDMSSRGLKFRAPMGSLSSCSIETETASELYEKLLNQNQDALPGFEKLLSKLSQEIEKSQMNVKKIENTIALQASEHDEKVQTLYNEMESQIKKEEEKLMAEVKAKEKQLKEELEQELEQKDRHYKELLKKHEDTKKRLSEISQLTGKTQQEIETLAEEKDMLEEALEETELNLEENQSVLEELRAKFIEDRRQRAATVNTVTKGISSEKDQLLAQLATLREINKKLKDERDETMMIEEDTSRPGSPSDPMMTPSGEVLNYADRAPINNYTDDTDGVSFGSQPQDIRRMKFSEATQLFGETMNVYEVTSKYGETIDDVDDGIEVDEEPATVSDVPLENRAFYRASSINASVRSAPPLRNEVREIEIQTDPLIEPVEEHPPKEEIPVKINYQLKMTGNEIIESVFKVVLIGDMNVGKTALLDRFCNEKFTGNYRQTVSMDFQLRSLIVENSILALQIWDTAGQERYESITKQYYRKADGVILVYDVMETGTFLNLKKWIDNVEENTPEEVMLMVLGNKIDLESEDNCKKIPTKQANDLSRKYGALFFEVSALNGQNVNDAFATLARILKSRQDQELNEAIKLTTSTTKKGCCMNKSNDRVTKRNQYVNKNTDNYQKEIERKDKQ